MIYVCSCMCIYDCYEWDFINFSEISRILFIMIVGICIIIYICYNYGYYFEVVCRGIVIVNFEDFLIELLVNIE